MSLKCKHKKEKNMAVDIQHHNSNCQIGLSLLSKTYTNILVLANDYINNPWQKN